MDVSRGCLVLTPAVVINQYEYGPVVSIFLGPIPLVDSYTAANTSQVYVKIEEDTIVESIMFTVRHMLESKELALKLYEDLFEDECQH